MFKQSGFRNKIEAAGIHLALSGGLVLIFACVVFFIWYPWPYSEVCGGLDLLMLVAAVDVTLGPLLTFVVFDLHKRKPVLLRDLGVIGVLQIAALIYGMQTVYLARPVALVFEGNRFRVVTHVEVKEDEFKLALPDLAGLSLFGPKLLGTRIPTETEKFDVINLAMAGMDIGTRPSFWIPYPQARDQALAKAKTMDTLYVHYPKSRSQIDAALLKTGFSVNQVKFLPGMSKKGFFTVLIHATSAEPIGFIMLDGFF
jgi:hypothetical protein